MADRIFHLVSRVIDDDGITLVSRSCPFIPSGIGEDGFLYSTDNIVREMMLNVRDEVRNRDLQAEQNSDENRADHFRKIAADWSV